ncbi:TPA: radical SAM protein [Candidatus Bipolaricaulota bacterium]|nr:radical SAM protein [Candidatus Bipolaricaulota bacterium]
MSSIVNNFSPRLLPGSPARKTALLVNPPVYDTQYWAQWSQPYGLLRIAALLKKYGYKRIELFDFMEVEDPKKIHKHRINPNESYAEEDEPSTPIRPYLIAKDGEELKLFKYHFGKTWAEFEQWLDERFPRRGPDEIFISAIMTYWWESVRDLTLRLKRRFPKSTILLGGIYPTLVPQHAKEFTAADLIVVGEVAEANDLWTDLSLYEKPPSYAIITPSRGCPFACAYCAANVLNDGKRMVRFRPPEDVLAEMRDKYETYGIKEFAFYADFLLFRPMENFAKVLEGIIQEKLPFRLHAPEGLDVSVLSSSQRLIDLMKAAGFQKIYLPCESIDEQFLCRMNRQHVRTEHFVKAVKMCERAGFRLRNRYVHAFVLYGLPEEKIDTVVKTIIFVSEIVGSIIPMLFTPVPATQVYQRYLPYIKERGWDKDLHMLNGKLYPFLELNEGSVSDYIDLQRLMFMLNSNYRTRSFQLFGNTRVSELFRRNLNDDFGSVIKRYKQRTAN